MRERAATFIWVCRLTFILRTRTYYIGQDSFEGKGYQVSDDLFTVAVRASCMLRNLTKKNYGVVIHE